MHVQKTKATRHLNCVKEAQQCTLKKVNLKALKR